MTNIFLACAIAFTVFYAVDSSFITFKKQTTNLEIQTDNIEELERIYLAKVQKISTHKSAPKITAIETETEVVKAPVAVAAASVKKPVEIKLEKKIKASNIELSYSDIPEQKIIKTKKLKQVAWTKLDLKLKDYSAKAYAKNDKIESIDRISTAQSAPEKSPVEEIKENDLSEVALNSKPEVKVNSISSSDEELVFFDYGSKPTLSAPEFQTESPVKAALSKLTTGGVVSTQKPTAQDSFIKDIEKEFSESDNKAREMVAKAESTVPAQLTNAAADSQKSEVDYQCLNEADLKQDEVFNTKYSLSLLEVDYKRSGTRQINNFELQFHDDANLYKEDYGNGEINLEFKMNSQISIRRATILSRGYYPTTLDMVFEPGEVRANIPVFSLDSFNKIMNENNLRGFGAHTLIELDDKTEDVEIDISKKYEAKFYLDKDFNAVSRLDSAYNYVLFIGVEAGNAILNFKRTDQKIINKLVYLAKDQIFYEPNFYAEIKSDIFSFYREGVLTRCKSLINIDPTKVDPWNYKGKVVKESLNSVKLSNMIYPVGSKKYVEIKYDDLRETIFVGRWGHENIVVPTEKYISHVIGQFGNSANANSCIMQLNIAKPVKAIAFNGQSSDQTMDMQIRILDSDGEFYQDFSEKSQRAFLMGQEEGTVNISINYVDGSTQYLQSFCSDATYIVEQL